MAARSGSCPSVPTSSCGASSYTCCPRASFVSVSSVSWPTAAEPPSCPSANNCSRLSHPPHLHARLYLSRPPTGLVPSAVDAWRSWRDSPRTNSSFAPLICEVSLTVPECHPTANTLRAPARTLEVCAHTEISAAPHDGRPPALLPDRPNVLDLPFSERMRKILIATLTRRTRPDRIQPT